MPVTQMSHVGDKRVPTDHNSIQRRNNGGMNEVTAWGCGLRIFI
jgi:hypothetical protein